MVYGRYIYPAGLKDIRGLRLITVKRSFFISHVQLCDLMDCRTPASLSFTISRCLLKLMSVELVMPSNHLIPCCPFSSCLLSFPASGSFLASQLFTSGGQSIGASASASVFPMNIQDWLPLGLTGLISSSPGDLEVPISFFFSFWLHHGDYGIWVPRPGIKHRPLAVKARSPNHWTSSEVPRISIDFLW